MPTYLELIIAPILFAYSLFIFYKWKEITIAKKFFIVISICFSILIAYNGIKGYEKQMYIEKVKHSFGEIEDESKTDMPTLCIGNPDIYRSIQSPNNPDIFKLEDEVLFKIILKNDRPYLNTIIRDPNRNVIAVIYENTWKIFSNDYEYNNDDNAFEMVSKGERKVVMHIEFKEGMAFVEGFFFGDKIGVYLYGTKSKTPTIKTPTNIGRIIIVGDNNDFKVHMKHNNIKPIFKYPREKHLGVRETNN